MNRFDWMRQTADELGYEINSLRRWAERAGFPLMGTADEVRAWHGKHVNQNGPPSKAERQRIAARDRELMRDRRRLQLYEQEGEVMKAYHDAASAMIDAADLASRVAGTDPTKRQDLRIYIAETAALLLIRCHPNYDADARGVMRFFWGDLLQWIEDNCARFEEENKLGIEQPWEADHPDRRYDAIVNAELPELPDEIEPG